MDNASAWGALGAGLSTLGEGLNAMQLRKLAEAQRKREEDRQKEQDALDKAIAQANAAKGMRSENFTLSQKAGIGTNSPDAMKAILNRSAMNTGGEETVDPVSGDTYYRAQGDSPNDQKVAQKERDLEVKQTLARIAADNAEERERIRQDAMNGRWNTQSKNNEASIKGRLDGLHITVGGENARAGNKEEGDVTAQRRAMIADYMKPVRQEDGSYARMPLAEATAAVDEIFGKSPAATASSGGRTEQQEMQRAQQKIQEIQGDPSLSPADKIQRVQMVNQVLTANIQKLRRGGV